jgi:hypothetical protein
MPTLFHVGGTAMCPHGGQVATISANTRVFVTGMAVATATDQFTVAGCAFNVSGAPHPCVLLQWLMPAARVKVMGQPVILQTSSGLAKAADQAPQGPPVITVTQPRVQGM